MQKIINIYTDGSCHTELKIGAWAAIILCPKESITLTGEAYDTTHNRMELLAAIEALNYIKKNSDLAQEQIVICSDSQYVVELLDRKDKLQAGNYLTKKGLPRQNADLVKQLISYMESLNLDFIKVKAHQKKTDTENYNRTVDKLSRKIVRQLVAEYRK